MTPPRTIRLRVFFLLLAGAAACESQSASPPAAAPPPPAGADTAPARVTPAPDAKAPGPAAPIAPAQQAPAPTAPTFEGLPPASACPAAPAATGAVRVDPPCGRPLIQRRGSGSLQVGRSGVLIALPDGPSREREAPECKQRGPVVSLRFPIVSSPVQVAVPPDVDQCDGVSLDPIRLFRIRDEPAAIVGLFPHNLSWSASVGAPFSPGTSYRFGFPDAQHAASLSAGYAMVGERLFAAVSTTRGTLVGFVAGPDGASTRGLLSNDTPLEEALTILVEPTGDDRADVTWMDPRRGPARQVTMGSNGAAQGSIRTVPRPAQSAAPFRIEVRRAGRSDPHLVAGPAGGPVGPISGLDPAAATFGPSFVEVGTGAWLLVWSEGLRRDTRIRAARFDPSSLAIVGPIGDVSTPGLEAGWSQIDSFGSNAAVLWNEKHDGAWEVRAAALRLP